LLHVDSSEFANSLLLQLKAHQQTLERALLSMQSTKSSDLRQKNAGNDDWEHHQPRHMQHQPPMNDMHQRSERSVEDMQHQSQCFMQYQRPAEHMPYQSQHPFQRPLERMVHQPGGESAHRNGSVPEWYVSNVEGLLMDNYQRGRETLESVRSENVFLSSMLKVRHWSK
jgi:hypothetical protein